MDISVRQIARLLKKYHIENGDILALKTHSQNANVETIDLIAKALERLNLNVLVIVVDDFNELNVLNETEMNKRGWFRLEKILRRIPTK